MLNILMREPAGRNVPYHASEDMIWPKILRIHSGFQSNLYNEHAYLSFRSALRLITRPQDNRGGSGS